MYYINLKIPLDERIKFDSQRKAAEIIGIDEATLCRILKGKQGTQKTTAYCITKYFNNNAEILDYFEFEGE
jgi:plasmid maintenance system antidote protein VapI